jgi:hypothetical protein
VCDWNEDADVEFVIFCSDDGNVERIYLGRCAFLRLRFLSSITQTPSTRLDPSRTLIFTGLSDILLYENLLEGTIPDLGTLTMLQWLDLLDNYLTGTVPRKLGLLTELEFLDLSCQADLDGALPMVRNLDC